MRVRGTDGSAAVSRQASPAPARAATAGLGSMLGAGQSAAAARVRWWGRREVAGALVLFAVIAAAHAAGTGIVSHLNRVSTSGEVFFPAAGVTVAALLLLPRRLWPLVLAAAFASELAADLVLGEPVITAVGSAVAGTAGPVVGAAMLLVWAGGPPWLSRRRPLAAFVAGPAVAGAAVGALIGAAATLFARPHGPFATVLARWWTGDVLGVLIVGGLVVAWLTETAWPVRPRHRVLEMCALAASAGVLTWLAFWEWHPGLTYLCLPPLGWAAVRFGARGATAVAMLMAVVGEWGTITDHGLFAVISHDHLQALWLVQLFLAVAILGGLVLANQVADLARAQTALRDSERAEREARLAAREAQAAERTRLARELHDSVSQALFSMAMHARTAQFALARIPHPEGGALARAVAQLRELTAGALAEMRALIFELRPDAVAAEGLVAALTRQAAAISAREQLPITVDGPDEAVPLPADAAEHCYRVALEALHNTVKHAGASHATVSVTADGGRGVRVSVTDGGAGFNTDAARPGHLGLRTMAERAEAAGGELELTSAPGAGTRVQLTVPAGPAAAAKGNGR
jgi:signal transduction histidine kinase